MRGAVKDPVSLAKEVREFGRKLGLRCPIPSKNKTLDEIYSLYVSPPDAVDYAMRRRWLDFSDAEKMKSFRSLYEKKGLHTFVLEAVADSTGTISPALLDDYHYFVVSMLHEGFHRAGSRLNYLFDEPAAMVIGHRAAITFFKERGETSDERAVRSSMKNERDYADAFMRVYRRRLADQRNGRHHCSCRGKNNAELLYEKHYYLYYPLVHLAYKAIGDLGGATDFFLSLPTQESACRKRLERVIEDSFSGS